MERVFCICPSFLPITTSAGVSYWIYSLIRFRPVFRISSRGFNILHEDLLMIIVIEKRFGIMMVSIILVMTLLFSSCLINFISIPTCFSTEIPQMGDSVIKESDINTVLLPRVEIDLTLEGPPLGSSITGKLEFSFGGWEDELDVVGVGYSEVSITMRHSETYSDIVGIGCDVMREYAFAYVGEQALFDNWRDGVAAGEYYRNNWPWDSGNSISASYIERINETSLAQLAFAGCIIEYENLTAHNEDGSSIPCGPRYVIIGANFTKNDDSWSINRIMASSDQEGVTVESTELIVALNELPALRPQYLVLLYGVPIAVAALVIGLIWSRKRKSMLPKDFP